MCKKLIEKLYLKMEGNLAFTDVLTKCHNRNYFEHIVKRDLETKDCWIVFADINGLKNTNDNCGHLEGDRQIVSLAQNMIRWDKDAVRFGGDEFVAILNTKEIAEEFTAEFENNTNFCFGIVHKLPLHSVNKAVEKADEIMRKKKHELKNERK